MITFDSVACVNALRTELIICMKQIQQELLSDAKSGMLTPQGKESLSADDITEVANVIIAGITGGAWAAMDEHGTGSLMDTDNPALDDYKNSPLWNPFRNDTSIRSRKRGSYTNIFGEQVNSRSNVGGINLEPKGGAFAPKPASHAIETAMKWMATGSMQEAVKSTLSNFKFSKFFIITKK